MPPRLMDSPFVLQRPIRPVPELFPNEDGEVVPWTACWGVFTVDSGYGGVYARATTVESHVEVINLSSGAYNGTALHVQTEEG